MLLLVARERLYFIIGGANRAERKGGVELEEESEEKGGIKEDEHEQEGYHFIFTFHEGERERERSWGVQVVKKMINSFFPFARDFVQ